jgi:hypothetical protein
MPLIPKRIKRIISYYSNTTGRSIGEQQTSPCEKLLPDDLLFEIFGLCIGTGTFFDEGTNQVSYCHQDRWKLENAPWCLGRVCGRWRAVLLSYPALWTTIEISRYHGFPTSLEMLKVYLERSQSAPLIIHWGWDRHTGEETNNNLRDIMFSHLVRKSCHRWRLFSFFDPTRLFYDSTGFVPTFPMLESLAFPLKSPHWLQPPGPTQLVNSGDLTEAFQTLPALASLDITRHLDAPIGHLPAFFPLKQLTTFRLSRSGTTYISAQEAVTLLQSMPNLIKCRLTPCISAPAEGINRLSPALVPSELSNLRDLDLGHSKAADIAEFWSQFRIPNLDLLVVLASELPVISTYVRQDSIHLTTISLKWFGPAPAPLDITAQFLTEQTSLRHISLTFSEASHGANTNITDNQLIYQILELFIHSKSRAVCPFLREFSIVWSRTSLYEDPWLSSRMAELLLQIAKSRDHAGYPSHVHSAMSPLELMTFTLSAIDFNEESSQSCLQVLKERVLANESAKLFLRFREEFSTARVDVVLSASSLPGGPTAALSTSRVTL